MRLKREKCQNITHHLIQMNILITLKTKFDAELTIIHMRVDISPEELQIRIVHCKKQHITFTFFQWSMALCNGNYFNYYF